ncbi:MAG: hypothetical protein AB4911_20825 [Oscillochloridaceae bacterium umkhey_bin13]
MANFLFNHLIALTVKLLIVIGFMGAVVVGYRPLTDVSAASNLLASPDLITSSVTYTLDQTDPHLLSGIGFSLSTSTPEAVVKVQFAEDGPVFTCTATSTAWNCPVFGVQVDALQNLRVMVHAQSADLGSSAQ